MTFPRISRGMANSPDLVEIEEVFIVNSTPQQFPNSINPALKPRDQVAAVYGNQAVQGLLSASGYFLSQFQLFTFSSPPDNVYTAAGAYWAVPMVTNTTLEAIPLVPPNLHYGLVDMLERRVLAFLYSQDDPRWAMVNQRYKDFCEIAAKYKSFSSQEATAAATTRRGVQASGGRGYGWSGRR